MRQQFRILKKDKSSAINHKSSAQRLVQKVSLCPAHHELSMSRTLACFLNQSLQQKIYDLQLMIYPSLPNTTVVQQLSIVNLLTSNFLVRNDTKLNYLLNLFDSDFSQTHIITRYCYCALFSKITSNLFLLALLTLLLSVNECTNMKCKIYLSEATSS